MNGKDSLEFGWCWRRLEGEEHPGEGTYAGIVEGKLVVVVVMRKGSLLSLYITLFKGNKGSECYGEPLQVKGYKVLIFWQLGVHGS